MSVSKLEPLLIDTAPNVEFVIISGSPLLLYDNCKVVVSPVLLFSPNLLAGTKVACVDIDKLLHPFWTTNQPRLVASLTVSGSSITTDLPILSIANAIVS